jgi:hypothetical protein
LLSCSFNYPTENPSRFENLETVTLEEPDCPRLWKTVQAALCLTRSFQSLGLGMKQLELLNCDYLRSVLVETRDFMRLILS